MNLKKRFQFGKKYKSTIFLLVSLVIFFLLIVFSLILYGAVDGTVKKNNYETSQKILSQVQYNVNYMDETVKKLCLSIFYNPDAVSLINEEYNETNFIDAVNGLNRLRTNVLNVNTCIHSVSFYNNKSGIFYNTSGGLLNQDQALKELIKSYPIVPIQTPIYRKIESGLDKSYVFTYIMYDSVDRNNDLNGAVCLNIKADWVLDSIKDINNTSKNMDRLYILDEKSEFIGSMGGGSELETDIKEKFVSTIKELIHEGIFFDSLQTDLGGKSYFVSYIYVKAPNWTIVKVQQYDEVYKYVYKVRNIIIIITLTFLVVAFFAAYVTSSRIYSPIGNLVREVSSQPQISNNQEMARDEVGFLRHVFKNSMENALKFEKERIQNRNIIKTYYLRKVLFDSYSMSKSEYQSAREQGVINIDINGVFSICLLRVDSYGDYCKKYNGRDQDLFKFAIANIFFEILSKEFPSEYFDLNNDQIVFIVNVKGDKTQFYSKMRELIEEARSYVLKYYRLSVSASISRITERYEELTDCFSSAITNSSYRYIYGRMCIITPQNVETNIKSTYIDYNFTLEKKLIDEIRSSNISTIEDTLLMVLSDMTKMNFNNIMVAVLHLSSSVKSTLQELNQVRLKPLQLDSLNHHNSSFDHETIDDLYHEIIGMIMSSVAIDKNKNGAADKNKILVDSIRAYIEANFADSQLSLSYISSMFRMSSATISKVFKEEVKMSLGEYINEIRILKAAELIMNSNLNINSVMSKVGIESETHFYRHFKKKFGTTPKEYALNRLIKEN